MAKGKQVKQLKNLQISVRVTEAFKNSLAALAERHQRSQANMLDVILRDYLTRNPLDQKQAGGKPSRKKVAKKKVARRR